MRIGVLCPAEIAYRRFMPALKSVEGIEYAGIGVCNIEERFWKEGINRQDKEAICNRSLEKAKEFNREYGGKLFKGYEELISSEEVDAVYIPLPPALHYRWAERALEYGKHVLIEKPSTLSAAETKKLVKIAEEKNLTIHENYMFLYHKQLQEIHSFVESGEIGHTRLIQIAFGFPQRAKNDFRYDKEMGGGALLDAGGYTIRYATELLGETVRIVGANLNYIDGFDVDMFGSGMLVNDKGLTAQVSFGMDNNYKCDLEIWGSRGCIKTGRVLTAPVGFEPELRVRKGNAEEVIKLSADDAFAKSIEHFIKCTENESLRKDNYKKIVRQAELVDNFLKLAKKA